MSTLTFSLVLFLYCSANAIPTRKLKEFDESTPIEVSETVKEDKLIEESSQDPIEENKVEESKQEDPDDLDETATRKRTNYVISNKLDEKGVSDKAQVIAKKIASTLKGYKKTVEHINSGIENVNNHLDYSMSKIGEEIKEAFNKIKLEIKRAREEL